MKTHEELMELAGLLPLGTLDAEDERQVEEHLRGGCAECEGALRAAAEVADALAAAEAPLEPSPGLRARILARAGEGRPDAAAPRRRRLARFAPALAAAAGVLVALGLGLEVRDLRAALEGAQAQVARLEAALGDAGEQRAGLEGQLAAAERTLEELTAQRTRAVSLAATGPLPGASARAFLDPESRRLVLVVYELPPPPPGRSYQLWVIVGGEPVSAGVFDVGPSGRARHEAVALPPIEGPVTIAVTVEPAGGLPKPSGPIVLAGS